MMHRCLFYIIKTASAHSGTVSLSWSANMAVAESIEDKNIPILRQNPLVYVHCVAKEDFKVIPVSIDCVRIKCREIHTSFPHSLAIRRVALCPVEVAGRAIDDLFNEVYSPALIRVVSSCNFKVRSCSGDYSKQICYSSSD